MMRGRYGGICSKGEDNVCPPKRGEKPHRSMAQWALSLYSNKVDFCRIPLSPLWTHWPFTAWFSTQYVTLLTIQPPPWLYCVIPNCNRLLLVADQHSSWHGGEKTGKNLSLFLTFHGMRRDEKSGTNPRFSPPCHEIFFRDAELWNNTTSTTNRTF